SHFTRLADSLQKCLADLPLVEVGPVGGRDARANRAGADAVGADVVRPVIVSDASRISDQGGFDGSVGSGVASADQALDRADVDDGAALLLNHERQHAFSEPLRPHQRNTKTFLPFLIRGLASIVPLAADVS